MPTENMAGRNNITQQRGHGQEQRLDGMHKLQFDLNENDKFWLAFLLTGGIAKMFLPKDKKYKISVCETCCKISSFTRIAGVSSAASFA